MNKNLLEIKDFLKGKAELIAVSKYRSTEEILSLYNEGQRIFAENRVQALLEREEDLPKDISWHLIGHLQRNKVKQVLPIASMIHSIDSLRLLNEVQKQSSIQGLQCKILLQVHVAKEVSKFGFKPIELIEFFENYSKDQYPNITICGLMAMATNTDNQEQIIKEFQDTTALFKQIKEKHFLKVTSFKDISMGMSGDYQLAVKEGSTMVRIGSLLFQ